MQATRFKGDLDECVPAGGKEENGPTTERECPIGEIRTVWLFRIFSKRLVSGKAQKWVRRLLFPDFL